MRTWIVAGLIVGMATAAGAQDSSSVVSNKASGVRQSPLELPPARSTDHATPMQPGFAYSDEARSTAIRTPYQASANVPLDSWIYPALDRLAAVGYLPTGTAIVRPLTRIECARLLAEAYDTGANYVLNDQPDETTASLLATLTLEFAHETSILDGTVHNMSAQTESIYERFTDIAGTPLRDGFNFGQTLVDDYGRPYGKGGNTITGLSSHAEAGPFAIYLRGEFQYAPAIPLYNAQAQQAIAANNGLPFGWDLRLGDTSRVRTMEAYAALNLRNWQLSFGQQALWWGPDRSTSLILSNNSEAMPMLRIARVKPLKAPGILSLLGPIHLDAFLAREGGIHYVGLGPTFALHGTPDKALNPAPFIWAVAATIKPTDNFELGLAHTTIFAGYGRPLTFGTFIHSLSTTGNAQTDDPGKRVVEVNLNYRLPGLRKNAIVYAEGMAWDDPLQGKFVARFAWDPGIYFPSLPKISRLDLRLEAAYTNLPKLPYQGYFYGNAHYPQGYTNYGQIIGSWIGRQGIGGQASSTYWFSARNKATLSYREMTADPSVLGGGSQNNVAASYTRLLRPDIEFSATGQYEHWSFPLLGNAKSNFASTFEVRFFPKQRLAMQ